MEQVWSRGPLVAPGVVALMLAVTAAMLFGISDGIGPLDSSTESLFMLTGIAGWAALSWAILVTGGIIVAVTVRACSDQTRSEQSGTRQSGTRQSGSRQSGSKQSGPEQSAHRRPTPPRSVSRLEGALLLASIALVTLEVALHPLWGSGTASA